MCFSRSILLWRRRRYFQIPSALPPLPSTKNSNSQKHWKKMDLQELTAFIIEKGKNRFPDPDAVAKTIQKAALAKYAGLAWQQHQSGNFEAQTTRMIHSSNRFLKYYLCEAAFSLVRCDKEYRDFYNLKYKEVNRFQHKRALALTARKLVRLVFRLLKDNCCIGHRNPNRFGFLWWSHARLKSKIAGLWKMYPFSGKTSKNLLIFIHFSIDISPLDFLSVPVDQLYQ